MRKKLILSVATILSLYSCSNDTNDLEKPVEPEIPQIELDYQYLTLNVKGSQHLGQPSISFMHIDSTMYKNKFYDVNGFQIKQEPNCATQIGETLYIGTGANFTPGSCGISIVEANTLKQIRMIDLGSDIIVRSIVDLGNNKILIAGIEYEGGYNLAVIDLSKDDLIETKFDTGNTITNAVCVGNKILLGNYYGDGYLSILDKDNITLEGLRKIKDSNKLFQEDTSFEVAPNGTVWTLSGKQAWGAAWLTRIDLATESFEHVLEIPYSSSRTCALTLTNDQKSIFIRAHEAVYKVNVDQMPSKLDEPYFEMMGEWSELKGLEMTKAGTLMVVNRAEQGAVLEYALKNKEWKLVQEISTNERPQRLILPL